MTLTDLLKGKIVNVMTDAKVMVELEIKSVEENITIKEEVLEPDTLENGWWGSSNTYRNVTYIATFTNGFTKKYSSIEQIPII